MDPDVLVEVEDQHWPVSGLRDRSEAPGVRLELARCSQGGGEQFQDLDVGADQEADPLAAPTGDDDPRVKVRIWDIKAEQANDIDHRDGLPTGEHEPAQQPCRAVGHLDERCDCHDLLDAVGWKAESGGPEVECHEPHTLSVIHTALEHDSKHPAGDSRYSAGGIRPDVRPRRDVDLRGGAWQAAHIFK